MPNMITIKWNGVDRLKPGRACPYFCEKPELFQALKLRQEIEIPEEYFDGLQAVVKVTKRKIKEEKKEVIVAE